MTKFISKIMYLIITSISFSTLELSCATQKTSSTKKSTTSHEAPQSMWKKTFGQFKSKKHKSKNPHPEKYIKDMNEQELSNMLKFAKETENNDLAQKVYGFLFMVTKDEVSIKKYKLDFADYNFTCQAYVESAFAYEDFTIHYPGSEEFEYAFYKFILSNFYLTLTHDRDQSNTNKTILKIEEFLRIAKKQQFIDEAQSILKQCRKKLFDHEVHVFENYVQQKKFTGAQQRLTYIKEQFQNIENIDKYTVYLESFLNTMKNSKTRSFIVKVDLTQALPQKEAPKTTLHDKSKTALYFLT